MYTSSENKKNIIHRKIGKTMVFVADSGCGKNAIIDLISFYTGCYDVALAYIWLLVYSIVISPNW